MNRVSSLILVVLLAASWCFGQAAAPSAVGHGAFPVKVTKTWDSSKLKEGDAVEAETAGSFKLADGTMVPKGSKLMGHVVAAKARSKGDSDSQLTVAFDKLGVANGKQLTVKGMVQAVFPPSDDVDLGANAMATTAAGGSATGGAGIGTVTDAKSGSNMESSTSVQPSMNPKSVGVQGMHGLDLNDGVLSSKGKNVKLGDGVRMIVRVDILG
jgi:hypothetical protein